MYSPGGWYMSSVRVQFVLNQAEFAQLKAAADEKGVSISKYVKDKVLPQEDSFEAIWDEFCDRLSYFPANIEFTTATVMGQSRWEKFDRSTKLSVSRLFNKKVVSESPEFNNITVVGRSPANVTLYKKIHY